MSTDNSSHADSHGSIMKSTSIVSAGTLSSRILGFLRDVILANIFGTGAQADAFFVALRIPSLFREMVGEGAANSSIVPVVSEYQLKENKKEFWQFVNVIFIFGLLILSVITAFGILLAPFIVRLLAPGFIATPEKLELTVRLTRIIFPYLILIGLTAHSMGILYTFRSFVVPAFSPCLWNISIITAALVSSVYMEEPVYGVALGVLIGGILQLFLQISTLRRRGLVFVRPTTLRHPGATRIGKLLVPRVFGVGVYQMNVLIDTLCASLSSVVGMGGISAIYFANRIIHLPMGIFSFSLAAAILPALSSLAAKKEIPQLKETLVFALKNIFFVMLPTGVLLMVLATPIIRVLFQRGEFNQYSTAITSMALFFYAVGLVSFGGIKILVTAFHALQDTKTPVKIAAGCLVLNATLNFVLMWPLKIGGIALASSIAGMANFALLFYFLNKKLDGIGLGLKPFVLKVSLAALASGLLIRWMWMKVSMPHEIVKLGCLGLLGFVIYALLCYALRIEQARRTWDWIIKSIRRS